MTILTYLALFASLGGLAIGFAITLGEAGYRFDLRRRQRRHGRDGRNGGRRSRDRMTAARSQ